MAEDTLSIGSEQKCPLAITAQLPFAEGIGRIGASAQESGEPRLRILEIVDEFDVRGGDFPLVRQSAVPNS